MEPVKILIIEDDQSLVSILKQAFADKRFELFLAGSVDEGLDQAMIIRPDIIILDILLPGKIGFDFLKVAKAKKELRDIPVVILSNLGQDEEIRTGLLLGAAGYLVKADFAIDEVVAEIIKQLKAKKN